MENHHELRFAIGGAVSLAIGEFDTRVTTKERDSDNINWRDNQEEWQFQYEEHLVSLLQDVISGVSRSDDYFFDVSEVEDKTEHYANRMLSKYAENTYDDW